MKKEVVMELEFYGASERITGSCHILRSGGYTILLDCGLIQGEDEDENRDPFAFDPRQIDAVILSHGHIDHSGRLPLLLRQGFAGVIYTHEATRDLAFILLQDSARLGEYDVRRENVQRARHGLKPLEPLYTPEDAVETVNRMVTLPYNQKHAVFAGVVLRFQDAGHILGSAITEVWLTENGRTGKIVYSGDLGQYGSPILNDPVTIEDADVVLIESTYGDRLHRPQQGTLDEIARVIADAGDGNILIPAFAIGRSQELLYLLGTYGEEWGLGKWQIFLDSPMAIEASMVYWNYPGLYDQDALLMRQRVLDTPPPENMHFTRFAEDSKKINDIERGAIVIAGSGMCNGGRILYHLKRNIERPECHVLITGYQAEGTLGRELVEGAAEVEIHQRLYRVAAQVHAVGGLSAHGDQHDLLRWAGGFRGSPRFYVVHGEEGPKNVLMHMLDRQYGYPASVPRRGDVIDVTGSSSRVE